VRASVRYFVCAALFAFGASLASAQSQVDIGVGFGAAFDKANPNLGADSQTGASCTTSTDATCVAAGSMNGFFLGFGGDILFYKHFGFGAEVNIEPGKNNWGPLQDRQIFYDFNGVYEPYSSKRASLVIEGGVGGARTSFSVTESGCVGPACSTEVEPVGSTNHFQVHAGVGVQIYLTHSLFIRPQFDFHYVPGLTNEFNSNAVPEATIWIGFNGGGGR